MNKTDRKSIVIFEDNFDHFEIISKAIDNTKFDQYPPKHDVKSFFEFKLLFYQYLESVINADGSQLLSEKMISIIPDNVRLFIVDFALLDRKKSIDETGGILRQIFLSKNYPQIPTIYVSVYSKEIIVDRGYMDEKLDYYIQKQLLFNIPGNKDNPLHSFLNQRYSSL